MISPSRGDWSLHRKGPADQARHMEKIKEAIRENLPEIIAEETIITSDGKRLIKVPIRSLEEYRFRFDPYQGEKVGQGDGDTAEGDVIGRRPSQERGQGRQAGNDSGEEYYEAEISLDELAELIFEDLGLPNLRPKSEQEVPSETDQLTEIRKKGPLGNLDKRRSIIESIKRLARQDGDACFRGLKPDDLRFRVQEQEWRRHSAAVVIAMRDASGSMGEFKKYLTRSLFFWKRRRINDTRHHCGVQWPQLGRRCRHVWGEPNDRSGQGGGVYPLVDR